MASSRLDQIVKGAPADARAPFNDSPAPLPRSYLEGATTNSRPTTPDPLSTLPSSPPQIYLNLLILEGSLRAQYLALRERRRQNTFFLMILAIWVAYFFYALFMRPREDGSGVGGSVYWMVETGEKVAFMGGIVTGILVWGTGQWERGMRWPRRWFAVANRGLRGMNTKIVLIRGPWWKEVLSFFSFIFPYSSLFQSPRNFQYVELHPSEKKTIRHQHPAHDDDGESGIIEEDLAPGGDYVRLLLLPKAFSPEFRENWDVYRADYWEKENERRAHLRRKVREREHQRAHQEGGWLWWLPMRQSRLRRVKVGDSHSHQHHHQPSGAGKPHEGRPRRNTRSNSQSLHSRGLSRGATPESGIATPPDPQSQRRKKGSKSSTSRSLSPLTTQVSKRDSTISISSTASDDSFLPGAREKRSTPEIATAVEA
ncbi:Spo7-like protein [Talaromyces proteolyticus]|uniref:Spo7-like protein n=1 Tax=Talaromyces proteolyticus TaxID=1131652 RepID=A0AAD4PXV0_9EURO|nr:Spo7-like protein [Talaromyces proteolyticus]KAH8700445.1 Spo7-like protein [Talaromyces proteolyticus]